MLSKILNSSFKRVYGAELVARLREPRRFIQVVAGPRQVGKTTLVRQVLAETSLSNRFVSADEPTLKDRAWLAAQWDAARELAQSNPDGAVLALDEVQKISDWSETVKRLWDEDTANDENLHVVLLGSAPLLMQRGLSESLAGRFEMIRVPHWSYEEMHAAFGITLDRYIWFGGYPGSAALIDDAERWRRYILDSLIETTISRDVLLLSRVDKPALLRRLFELTCRYSGQVLSYTKMLGQLTDAGNATTLAHYLDLLSGAGLVTGLQKYAGEIVRSRGSIPKLQVLNTALMTAQLGIEMDAARSDPALWGRLVESAVGSHLANAAARGICELYYWRAGNREVDFVIRRGGTVVAFEVKTGRLRNAVPALQAFSEAFNPDRTILVGGDGVSIEEFLLRPVESWLTR